MELRTINSTFIESKEQGFLLSYFKKKAEDLATKDNIEEITRKIESVRLDYARPLEEIKATLAAHNQQRFRLFDKRTDALIQFYEEAYSLGSRLLAPFHFRYEDIELLDNYIRDTQDRIAHVLASYHRLLIYLPQGEVTRAAGLVHDPVFTVAHQWYDHAIAYRNACFEDAEIAALVRS